MNDVQLKDYLEAIIIEKEKQDILRHEAADRALALANEEQQRQYHRLNNLRTEVLTDRALFVPCGIFEARVKPLEAFRDRALGIVATVSMVSAGVGGILGAVIARLILK